MKECHLQLDLSKTEVLLIPASPSIQEKIHVQFKSTLLSPPKSARDMGIMTDDQLNLQVQVTSAARSRGFALSSVRKIRPFLSEHAVQLLVQALVVLRLHHCESLLASRNPHLPQIQNLDTRLQNCNQKDLLLI